MKGWDEVVYLSHELIGSVVSLFRRKQFIFLILIVLLAVRWLRRSVDTALGIVHPA